MDPDVRMTRLAATVAGLVAIALAWLGDFPSFVAVAVTLAACVGAAFLVSKKTSTQAGWGDHVRVIAHEVNNSAGAIQTNAEALRIALENHELPAEVDDRIRTMQRRAEGIAQFVDDYAQLARTPNPRRRDFRLTTWLEQTAQTVPGVVFATTEAQAEDDILHADRDQLDRVMINLLRNAADATDGSDGLVRIGYRKDDNGISIWVEDNGPGLTSTDADPFTPFFTTKPHGTGIGLAISRQIIEAHGGTLKLENRGEGGCRALIALPQERMRHAAI